MALRVLALFLIVCLVGLHLPLGEAVWLNLRRSTTRCVSEVIQTNIDVSINYNVIGNNQSHDLPDINAKVTSPYGQIIYKDENATEGRFEFRTTAVGKYLVCFWLSNYHEEGGASINLDWKIGIAARDWDSVARKEKLKGVELELKKHEAIVESIHEKMLHLKSREAEMRMVSEKTNDRVEMFSIMSVGICVVVSVLQLWYLKRYFQKKRIIM
ncbi:PREDICTED: transmembrane emp24 domain-containing protein p24delta3-like [Nelumbo nucifera]|uniref:GOLD domain-containing protein n=2 Tax=Nelumbo nucifera TaxID=4432 RepID=A0A822Z815_NELNU|nr:PREDICTED: transmembrane emp24 domain-containing protein p24delta3-like [Nelumbo nucifera]DAD39615.1 TPA_asm: hypothetical protein HUJ06_013938 [Nelumbo nucifera]